MFREVRCGRTYMLIFFGLVEKSLFENLKVDVSGSRSEAQGTTSLACA